MAPLALPTTIGPAPVPIILAGVFTPLAMVAVALRFYARHTIRAPLMMDDWIILPALLFAVGQAVILVVNACIGDLGKHQPLNAMGYAIPSPKLTTFQQLEYVSFLSFVPALLFAKLSVLHLYNRVFKVQRAFRVTIWLMYGLNVTWGVAFFVGYIFKCWPISDYWNTANEQGRCLPNSFNYAFAFSNVILDAAILVMPLPVVWGLNMAWRPKLAVSGIFLLGSIVVALSIAKAVAFFYTFEWVEHDHDIMFDEAPLFYFSVPEALVAVISACLPTLRPLFRRMATPIVSSMSQTKQSASAAASKTIDRLQAGVELSPRGVPTRPKPEHNFASPAGLGRERGLGVSRKSMAGGVMWERYTRLTDELATERNYVPWQRDSEYLEVGHVQQDTSTAAGMHQASRSYISSSDEENIIGGHGLGLNLTDLPPPTPSVSHPSPLGMIARQASYLWDEPRTSGGVRQSGYHRGSLDREPTQPREWIEAPHYGQGRHLPSYAGAHVRDSSEEVLIAIPLDEHRYQ